MNSDLSSESGPSAIVAAGVGNTSLQFSIMHEGAPLPLPRTHHILPVVDGHPQFTPPDPDDYHDWVVASVNAEGTERLRKWAQQLGADSFRVLSNDEFPIRTKMEALDKVGSDRLAAAVAANRLREANRPAIFIDAGTALTVNAICDEGVFLGGAILPGAGTSLSALAQATAQLPQVALDLKDTNEAPLAIGNDTHAAIRSGVYWGLVGAARELVAQMSKQLVGQPQVFITGGFGPWLSAELTRSSSVGATGNVRFVPHLVLSGVALTAETLA